MSRVSTPRASTLRVSTSRSVKTALVTYGVAILVAFAAIHHQTSPALASDCEAVDMNDLPRECTFMEEYGACLVAAMDSLDTCLDAATSLLGTAGCWIGYEVDFYACLPAELLGSLLP